MISIHTVAFEKHKKRDHFTSLSNLICFGYLTNEMSTFHVDPGVEIVNILVVCASDCNRAFAL